MPSEGAQAPSDHDPSLLILYRHLRAHTPNASVYEGDEEFSAVVRAAEAYEHYGCPLLSLVILKHWGYVTPVDTSSKRAKVVKNLLQVRRESIYGSMGSTSTSSFMGVSRSAESPKAIGSGVLDFNNFGTTTITAPVLGSIERQETAKPNGMSLMGGFKNVGPPPELDSGTFDIDSFGAGSKKPSGGGMSLMGGFKSAAPPSAVDSGMLDFDSFNSASKKPNSETSDTPGSTGMSLMGGFKQAPSSSNIESGMLDFDTFGSSTLSKQSKTKDIFAGFAPPEGNLNHGLSSIEKRESGGHGINDDTLRGTEELLNDYITTLVVQLLTVSLVHFH